MFTKGILLVYAIRHYTIHVGAEWILTSKPVANTEAVQGVRSNPSPRPLRF